MAKKSKADRHVITLECTSAASAITRRRRTGAMIPVAMELKKFCPRCRAHQLHRETR